jgi:hypothetical protein
MMTDTDWRVRLAVSQRLPVEQLGQMQDDVDEDVRAAVLQRIKDKS